MLWQGRKGSTNVEDRRGVSGGQVAVGGGILGVIALVLNFLLGGDVSQLPQQLPNQNAPVSAEQKAADDQRAQFVGVVLQDTEDVWNTLFQQAGKNYEEPPLVLNNQSEVTSYILQTAGLAVVPFYAFGADSNSPWYRLSVGTCREEEIEEMLAKLKKALKQLS